MKKFKNVFPVLLFLAIFCTATTVFAQRVYTMTIYIGRGETKTTSSYAFEAGRPRISYKISEINGSSNKLEDNSTKLHIIMRDQNDTTLFDVYRDENNNYYNSNTVVQADRAYGAGQWYAQFSTKINGISYASFYSSDLLLASAIN